MVAPNDISGLIRWGKADALTLANNDPVDSYTDQSGSGAHFIASGAARPTFKTSVQNGLAAILFDGSGNYLTRDALGATLSGTNTPFSFFCVFKHTSFTTLHQCFFILANITGSSTPTHDLYYRSETGNYFTDRRDDAGTIKRAQAYRPDTAWHTLVFTYDGTTATLYIDGVSVHALNQSMAALTANSFTFGSHRRVDATDAFFNGYWGEDGLYNVALTPTNATDLHAYMVARWGISTASQPWTPVELGSTLRAWWDYDSWNFVADGDSAVKWWNKEYNGTTPYDLTTTGTLKYNAIGGRSALLMNGTSDVIHADTLAALVTGSDVAFTMFGVFKSSVLTPSSEIFGFGNSANVTALHRLQFSSTGVYRIDRRSDASTLVTATGGTTTTEWNSFVQVFTGTAVTLYINGVAVISAASLDTGTATLDKFSVGVFKRFTTDEWFSGYIAEVGMCDTALSGSNLTSLLAYLESITASIRTASQSGGM